MIGFNCMNNLKMLTFKIELHVSFYSRFIINDFQSSFWTTGIFTLQRDSVRNEYIRDSAWMKVDDNTNANKCVVRSWALYCVSSEKVGNHALTLCYQWRDKGSACCLQLRWIWNAILNLGHWVAVKYSHYICLGAAIISNLHSKIMTPFVPVTLRTSILHRTLATSGFSFSTCNRFTVSFTQNIHWIDYFIDIKL